MSDVCLQKNDVSAGEVFEDENEEKKCYEPFPFLELPVDSQLNIIEKISITTFLKLRRTSKELKKICDSKKFLFRMDVGAITVNKRRTKVRHYQSCEPWDITYLNWYEAKKSPVVLNVCTLEVGIRLTNDRCEELFKLFSDRTPTVRTFTTKHLLQCDPAHLERLLIMLKVSELDIPESCFFNRSFFQLPTIQNMEYISVMNSGCGDDELMEMKSETIQLGGRAITSRGINRFLKSWKRGERAVKYIYIDSDVTTTILEDAVILDGLEANVIWTRDDHVNSLLSQFSAEDLNVDGNLYSIHRPNDISNFGLMTISACEFSLSFGIPEKEHLLSVLDDDQHYALLNECYYCETQFCCHHRKYSTVTFAKKFPVTWEIFMSCVRISGFVLKSHALYTAFTSFSW